MLEYYTNQKAGIFFDDNPHVCIRYYIPSMTEEERKSIEKYPFINKKNLQVRLCDYQKDKTYNFGIPKGYCYDGASIRSEEHTSELQSQSLSRMPSSA